MHENEEPWNPPKPQCLSNMPKILSQVPEITILFNDKKTVASSSKPSTSFPLTHLVPDLSIIDQTKTKASPTQQSRNFSQSYKDMLLTTHEQIIKQNPGQTHGSAPEETQPTRQGLLVAKSYDYKPNPLSKYLPSKISNKTGSSSPNLGNLSSILIDVPSQSHERSLTEQSDLQLRNVAGILSEIQKLVTPSKVEKTCDGENDFNNPQRSNVILQKFAKMYLSDEEYSSYAIDEELSKIF